MGEQEVALKWQVVVEVECCGGGKGRVERNKAKGSGSRIESEVAPRWCIPPAISAFHHLWRPRTLLRLSVAVAPLFVFPPSAMIRIVAFATVLGATHGFVTPNVVRSAIPAEVSE